MNQNKVQVIVLAAGHGKRMKQKELPKVLLPLHGRPLISYVLEAIQKSGICSKPVIVIGQKASQVQGVVGPNYYFVLQPEQLGTGHAVACTKHFLNGKTEHIAKNVLVLYGDMPLINSETIKSLAKIHLRQSKVLTMATVTVPDFDGWRQGFYDFGRVIRDENGKVTRIVEKKDATPSELEIKEVNPSCFCFQAGWLWQNIEKLSKDNAQSEYYLTDLAQLACQQNQEIATINIDPKEALGVNTEEQLKLIEKIWQDQK